MRIAALYDIHGNLPALEAVLHEVEGEQIDEIVIGGDVFPGPLAAECIELLSRVERPMSFVHGDGETQTLALADGGEGESIPEPFRGAMREQACALSETILDDLRSWPRTLARKSAGVSMLFCHATPRSDRQIFTERSTNERVAELLRGVEADLLVCGHTHMQFDRQVGPLHVVNAGSVGMPFGAPGAHWAILGEQIELRSTIYDAATAAARLRAARYALADHFADQHVLTQPSAEQMLEAYAQADAAPPLH